MAIGISGGLALAKRASLIANWLTNRKRGNFSDTAYGKRLRERMEHGKYSPEAETRIVGGVAKSAGNIAQKAGASYRGRLASRGMEGSIAGQRGLSEIETRPIEAVTRTRERIATEDEMAKESAKDEFAAAKMSYRERLDELNRRNNTNLVGGLVDAGAGYLVSKSKQAAFEGFDQDDPASVRAWAKTQPDPMAAMGQAAQMNYRNALANRSSRTGRVDKTDYTPSMSEITSASDADLWDWVNSSKNQDERLHRLNIIHTTTGRILQPGTLLGAGTISNEGVAR